MTRDRWPHLIGELLLWAGGGVVAIITFLFACYFLASWLVPALDGKSDKAETAQEQAGMFRSQILLFRSRHGCYPVTLDELVAPKSGGRPLVEGGPLALHDPWGNRYQFEIIPGDETTLDEVAVWTVSPKGERIESMRSRNRRR